ncbi:S1C family serine protease [Planctomycetota bacterium]
MASTGESPSRRDFRFVVACVANGLLAACLVSGPSAFAQVTRYVEPTPFQTATELEALEEKVRSAAREALPAIVAILGNANAPDRDAASERLARHVGRMIRGDGTGVIIRGDGLILSQAHVSHERDGINPETGLIFDPWQPGHTAHVVLHDGRRLEATLLGADYERDLSLLEIVEDGEYPHLELSERPVKLGDWVLKAGHPYGYRSDRGTVFRVGRTLYSGTLDIVADCQTSGGDSGGPFLNIDGEVVGMVGNSMVPQQIGVWYETRGVAPMSYVPVPILHERIPAMLAKRVVPRVGYGVHSQRKEEYENAEEFLAPRHWTQGEVTKAAWRDVTARTTGSVVEVLRQGERAAFGTVVDAEGSIVTKASELGESPQCRLPNGKIVDAEVSRTIAQFDLAILKVATGQLRPIPWTRESPRPQGTLVAAGDHLGRPLALGIVSVEASNRYAWPFKEVKTAPLRAKPRAYLASLLGKSSEQGFHVEHAYGQAAKAGIQAGDVILAVNNNELGPLDSPRQMISGLTPGTEVQLRLARGSSQLDLTAPLTAMPYMEHAETRSYFQSFRWDDFPVVFEHDIALWLDECGGPVIDLDGRAIGITIARVGPHGCMAIPAEVVKSLLEPPDVDVEGAAELSAVGVVEPGL